MKRAIAAVLSAVSLAAGAASLTETFDSEAARLDQQVAAGKLTESGHARAMAQLARDLFPRDGGLIELRDFKVGLAERFERGDVTKAQYDSLWTARRDAYYQQRDASRAAPQSQAVAASGISTATALAVGAASFNRAQAVNQPTTCRTTGAGAATYTTCQ